MLRNLFLKSNFFRIFVLFILLSGCTKFDIKKAQKFGHSAENFEDTYSYIVKDLYQSCKRVARYRGNVREGSSISLRRQLESNCLAIAYNEKALLMAHEVLEKYTGAFRKISSDEFIEELDGAGKLAESLLSLPIPALSEVGQVAQILPIAEFANAIQRAIADEKRKKVLKKSVLDVNRNVQLYISILSQFTEDVYLRQLKSEEDAMNLYYSEIISQELDKSEEERESNPAQVSVLLADDLWKNEYEKANFPERYNQLNSYILTLKSMAKAHQELYADVANFDD